MPDKKKLEARIPPMTREELVLHRANVRAIHLRNVQNDIERLDRLLGQPRPKGKEIAHDEPADASDKSEDKRSKSPDWVAWPVILPSGPKYLRDPGPSRQPGLLPYHNPWCNPEANRLRYCGPSPTGDVVVNDHEDKVTSDDHESEQYAEAIALTPEPTDAVTDSSSDQPDNNALTPTDSRSGTPPDQATVSRTERQRAPSPDAPGDVDLPPTSTSSLKRRGDEEGASLALNMAEEERRAQEEADFAFALSLQVEEDASTRAFSGPGQYSADNPQSPPHGLPSMDPPWSPCSLTHIELPGDARSPPTRRLPPLLPKPVPTGPASHFPAISPRRPSSSRSESSSTTSLFGTKRQKQDAPEDSPPPKKRQKLSPEESGASATTIVDLTANASQSNSSGDVVLTPSTSASEDRESPDSPSGLPPKKRRRISTKEDSTPSATAIDVTANTLQPIRPQAEDVQEHHSHQNIRHKLPSGRAAPPHALASSQLLVAWRHLPCTPEQRINMMLVADPALLLPDEHAELVEYGRRRQATAEADSVPPQATLDERTPRVQPPPASPHAISVESAIDGATFVPDAAALGQLEAMGLPAVRCIKALHATGNSDADTAMNWLFQHMEDPDIDDPLDFDRSRHTEQRSLLVQDNLEEDQHGTEIRTSVDEGPNEELDEELDEQLDRQRDEEADEDVDEKADGESDESSVNDPSVLPFECEPQGWAVQHGLWDACVTPWRHVEEEERQIALMRRVHSILLYPSEEPLLNGTYADYVERHGHLTSPVPCLTPWRHARSEEEWAGLARLADPDLLTRNEDRALEEIEARRRSRLPQARRNRSGPTLVPAPGRTLVPVPRIWLGDRPPNGQSSQILPQSARTPLPTQTGLSTWATELTNSPFRSSRPGNMKPPPLDVPAPSVTPPSPRPLPLEYEEESEDLFGPQSFTRRNLREDTPAPESPSPPRTTPTPTTPCPWDHDNPEFRNRVRDYGRKAYLEANHAEFMDAAQGIYRFLGIPASLPAPRHSEQSREPRKRRRKKLRSRYHHQVSVKVALSLTKKLKRFPRRHRPKGYNRKFGWGAPPAKTREELAKYDRRPAKPVLDLSFALRRGTVPASGDLKALRAEAKAAAADVKTEVGEEAPAPSLHETPQQEDVALPTIEVSPTPCEGPADVNSMPTIEKEDDDSDASMPDPWFEPTSDDDADESAGVSARSPTSLPPTAPSVSAQILTPQTIHQESNDEGGEVQDDDEANWDDYDEEFDSGGEEEYDEEADDENDEEDAEEDADLDARAEALQQTVVELQAHLMEKATVVEQLRERASAVKEETDHIRGDDPATETVLPSVEHVEFAGDRGAAAPTLFGDVVVTTLPSLSDRSFRLVRKISTVPEESVPEESEPNSPEPESS